MNSETEAHKDVANAKGLVLTPEDVDDLLWGLEHYCVGYTDHGRRMGSVIKKMMAWRDATKKI